MDGHLGVSLVLNERILLAYSPPHVPQGFYNLPAGLRTKKHGHTGETSLCRERINKFTPLISLPWPQLTVEVAGIAGGIQKLLHLHEAA